MRSIRPDELPTERPGGLIFDEAVKLLGCLPSNAYSWRIVSTLRSEASVIDNKTWDARIDKDVRLLKDGLARLDGLFDQFCELTQHVLLREGLFERLSAGEVECFGLPLYNGADHHRRIWIPPPLIFEFELSFRDEWALNSQYSRDPGHPRALAYAEVRFQLRADPAAPSLEVSATLGDRNQKPSKAIEAGKPPSPARKFRGLKGEVWQAAQQLGCPDFARRGMAKRYADALVTQCGGNLETVYRYVTKNEELRGDIEALGNKWQPPEVG